MWLSLIRNTEWSQFLDLASPSFFEVLPARAVASQLKELFSNLTSSARARTVRSQTADRLQRAQVGVSLVPLSEGAPTDSGGPEVRQANGEAVLRLYFEQLFRSDVALLDLRGERFSSQSPGELQWDPKPLYVEWESTFLTNVRNLYRGFYGGNDELFRTAILELQLKPAEEIFRRHFGQGEQRSVPFRLSDFQRTFHEAFVRCRDAGNVLHPNFIPLGLYLTSLYGHLEKLNQTFDVRASIERVLALPT